MAARRPDPLHGQCRLDRERGRVRCQDPSTRTGWTCPSFHGRRLHPARPGALIAASSSSTRRADRSRPSEPRRRTRRLAFSDSRRPVVPCTTSRTAACPRQRHTQHRAPDGSLYAEELFGVEGFTGRSSLLYHLVAADADVTRIEPVGRLDARGRRRRLAPPPADRHGRGSQPPGDAITRPDPAVLQRRRRVGRGPARPSPMPADTFYRNGEADEMLFVHEGTGVLRHDLRRPRATSPGDYLVLPIGTTWRLDPDAGVGAADAVPRVPVGDRAAEALPQRLRPAPRALAVLAARHPDARSSASRAPSDGDYRVIVRARDRHHGLPLRDTTRSTSSAGTATCGRSRSTSRDFQPITGRVHQPPPVHQTFQARNFVVCSFVPRKFDYHPLAIPAPYNHSNINSDEVIYYVAGNFMSRRGRGDRVVHAPPGGHPARAAPGHGRGVDRQGGDRGAGGDGRHVPPAVADEGRRRRSRTRTTRTRGCRRTTTRGKPPSSRSEARRRSRTDPGMRSVSERSSGDDRSTDVPSGSDVASMPGWHRAYRQIRGGACLAYATCR